MENSEENQTQTLDDNKLQKVADFLEKNMVAGFSNSKSKSEITIYLCGAIESLEHFGGLTKEESNYLYSLYVS